MIFDQAERKMQLCVSLYIKQPYQLENPVINPAAYFNTSKASAESTFPSPFILTYGIVPQDVISKVIWKSSDESVVSVSDQGVITIIALT